MNTTESQTLKRTPLYPQHQDLGAKFTGFGGWDMPVQYSGVIDEHNTVRSAVGLFDVSHMGELLVRGDDALAFLQQVTTNDLSRVSIGQAQYSLLLNHEGGVVDDIIIYRLSDAQFFLCVNASNADKDFEWLRRNVSGGVEVINQSSNFAQLALQGPKARELVGTLFGQDYSVQAFPSFTFQDEQTALGPVRIAATGYTGEDGVEIFCAPEAVTKLWCELLEKGRSFGIKPIGLGARDTLRLEACYPLHGHELRDDLLAYGCGVDWVIKLKKEAFVGREALLQRIDAGIKHQLIGFEVVDPGIVRGDSKLYHREEEVGWTSSGTKTPTINKSVGLGFVIPELSAVGTELEADVRGRRVKIRVIRRPFYKRS